MSKKTLHLSLKKEWFDLMVSGEKKIEYRSPSKWIATRLKKDYDTIKFTNGYGNSKPYFLCEFKGFEVAKKDEIICIDNHDIYVKKGDYKIKLGKILETRNIKFL